MEIIEKYFPEITEKQRQQFGMLQALYEDWNAKINVISRKDLDELYLRHVLHSLGIAKVLTFKPGAAILDVGTGGGFPGIPLAILFPETTFYLVDSIGKKIKVVKAISEAIGLDNVEAHQLRAENVQGAFDFVISRAVTKMPDFVKWIKGKVHNDQKHSLANGVLYLKGGDLSEELSTYEKATLYPLSHHFEEAFFETKKVVHLPIKKRAGKNT
ncbi:16S rRNA (guanine(527)-N(7))-methyltransferase RsmG [Sungkyunkwania multivorans]|uniref:Ribosomal RNA small subunit methyltransferase G n=1 Tax=Sungkyunkwania multivorans TaxID=1173618 RepID=A0ABW3D0P2_9FLAO